MAWKISGTYYAPCSCKVGCPCTLGEMEADHGWCSAVMLLDIRSGAVDGTDVSNTKVAMAIDWPAGMLAGKGTGRTYFDPAVSQRQRAVLEGVLTGKKGGVFEVMGTLVSKLLPPKEAPVTIKKSSEETRATVGNVGELVVKPLKGPSGQVTRLLHGAAAFRDDIVLAKGTGTHWRDPEMKRWESGGHAEQSDFEWSA